MKQALWKRWLFALFVLLFSTGLQAQEEPNPVHWSVQSERTAPDRFTVRFTARIDAPWHMYDIGPYEGGPNATTFTFKPDAAYRTVGALQQITQPVRKHDPLFDMQIGTFASKAVFTQQIQLIAPATKVPLEVNIEWMACDETSCLSPTDRDIFITLQTNPNNAASANTASSPPDTPVNTTQDSSVGTDTPDATPDSSIQAAATQQASGGSLWGAVIEAILWGLAALLTPCVFPMIPMTVSFFLKGSENKRRGRWMAALYGISIITLYTVPIAVIILITRLLGGESVTADIFNWLATHWIPNVIFFLVFMLFAASFLGAFEITLPGWMVNKSDSKADKGGIIGVFFMALTLVLVSFSCTGPIVGSVLIKSTAGEVWAPVITMFAFSAAFALPFTLFALFPSLLNKLPKSGGWLNSVKVVLGFLELALGLKFLSVADQTYHWGILDREIYLALWIVIFSLLGLYLLGKLRFAHDSEAKTLSVTRLLLAIVTFSFVVYLLPGMWGAPLKGLSGYLPPIETQDFVPTQQTHVNSDSQERSDLPPVKYSDFLHLPHGLEGFFDFDQALEYARKVKKPLFVDYTGHGCVNCREMEARVWSDPEVLRLLRDDFVIVALYSDDKKELPESDWVTTSTGKTLKGLGKINAYLAHKRFGINSQPYYLILDGKGEPLLPGRGYNLDIPEFVSFLKTGLTKFRTTLSL